MRGWLTVFAELYDPRICNNWCFPFFVRTAAKPFSCVEEHEAVHARWVQSALTFDEWLKAHNRRAV